MCLFPSFPFMQTVCWQKISILPHRRDWKFPGEGGGEGYVTPKNSNLNLRSLGPYKFPRPFAGHVTE